ncbi:MAG TPA: hypothetical protein VK184_01420 [Nostocaceae cyanobacterium]|nr:hypothetical protein [Nostocaceae cyanobacterium]
MNYLAGRQNPIHEVLDDELNKMLGVLALEFSKEWLNTRNNNPVQQLWQRQDWLSTCELLLLGNAIKTLKPIAAKWVSDQVKTIKQEDKNNRRGALFELLALSLFDGEGVSIKPAARNNPGYDGTILLPRSHSIKVSIKSYGMSNHQQEFNNQCNILESELKKALSERQLTAVGFLVRAKNYPTQSDWEILRRRLPQILDSCQSGNYEPFEDINKSCWVIKVQNLSIEDEQFSPIHRSYTFLVVSPYHNNERKNLYDKLDEACANFTKHSVSIDPLTTTVVFIDVPTSASITSCKEWATQYFQERENSPIGLVVFYQPTVVTDEQMINHCLSLVDSSEFSRWLKLYNSKNNSSEPPISASVFVGGVSDEPTRLCWNGNISIPINDLYVYQKGEHYLLAQGREDGTQYGHIRKQASGIFQHLVVPQSEGHLILKGIFPPSDELLLW